MASLGIFAEVLFQECFDRRPAPGSVRPDAYSRVRHPRFLVFDSPRYHPTIQGEGRERMAISLRIRQREMGISAASLDLLSSV